MLSCEIPRLPKYGLSTSFIEEIVWRRTLAFGGGRTVEGGSPGGYDVVFGVAG